MVLMYLLQPLHFLKANFDGGVFQNEGCCGIGVVIRDNSRNFIARLTSQVDGVLSVKATGALAAKTAFHVLLQLQATDIILKGDSQAIIESIISLEDDQFEIGPVFG